MDDTIHGCDVFGEDDYIDGWDGLSNLEDCTSYVEPELDISDFEYYTDNGFNLAEANWYYFYTDNKFMMFDRTRNGMTVENWIDGTEFMYYGRNNNFKGNLFLLMNRTKQDILSTILMNFAIKMQTSMTLIKIYTIMLLLFVLQMMDALAIDYLQ